MEHNRNHFIAWVIYAILLLIEEEIPHVESRKSFAVELPSLVFKPRINGTDLRPRPAKSALFDASVGKAILQAATTRGERLRAQRLIEAAGKAQEHLKPFCTACERTADKIKEYVTARRKHLNQCSACHALNPPRRIYYCSKDCAQIDWKAGHKLICGKLHSDLRLPFAGQQPVPSSPPPSVSRQIISHQKKMSIPEGLARLSIADTDTSWNQTHTPPLRSKLTLIEAEELFNEGTWGDTVPDLVEHYMNVLREQAVDGLVSSEQFRSLAEEGLALFVQRTKISAPVDINGSQYNVTVRKKAMGRDRRVRMVL
ncbi:hypothetical protein JCM5353_003143 [Sporobolomyces roseus]